MGYREIMGLPISVFWFMGSQVNRVSAERDMRMLTLLYSAQSGEFTAKTREQLTLEIGEVIKQNPIISAVRDLKGIEELKML